MNFNGTDGLGNHMVWYKLVPPGFHRFSSFEIGTTKFSYSNQRWIRLPEVPHLEISMFYTFDHFEDYP